MTCYETLRAPAPAAADAPMAHHFVKWWRNKFRNGYKKFSMVTEGERTDTEELVGRAGAASQCSAPPDLLPSEARALLQPASPSPPAQRRRHAYKRPPSPVPLTPIQTRAEDKPRDDKPRLRFEELTCDVELKHPEPSKQQPLQFSFTLYDLDGHGRMTKDDIAGIVSTIYESIGKSVTVPHYGSKTIQVRLTVVPEDCSQRSQRAEERHEARRRRRREARTAAPAPPSPPAPDRSDDDQRDRLSHEHDHDHDHDDDNSSKSSSSGERRPAPRPAHPRPHRNPRRDHRERRHTKKRSGSLQRRELLEIIQANMEKNHLNFQATRKPSEPVANEEEITNKYQKLRNRSYTVSEKPTHAFQKSKSDSPGNGYLDLASGGDSHLCRYDRYLHAVICSSARHAHTGYHHKVPPRRGTAHHGRSRSHDLPAASAANAACAAPTTPTTPAIPAAAIGSSTHQPRVLQIIFL